MPPEISPSEGQASERTIDDIRRERGEYFPQKHRHDIRTPKDRRDFLIAAYAMITHRKTDTFHKLLYAGRHTIRMQMIHLIKGAGGQLGLLGIIKKILSYDAGMDIAVPNDAELRWLLEEMQRLFEPARVPNPKATTSLASPVNWNKPLERTEKPIDTAVPRSFLGRPIRSPQMLAILDAIPVLPDGSTAVPHSSVSSEMSPKTAPKLPHHPSITRPIADRVQKVLQPQKYRHPAPRRWFGDQQPGRRKWVIPGHIRTELEAWAKDTQPEAKPFPVPTSASVSARNIKPTFQNLPEALQWLRGQERWHGIYEAIHSAQDDLAALAALRDESKLLPILLQIQRDFGQKSRKAIIRRVLYPESEPQSKPEPEPAPEWAQEVIHPGEINEEDLTLRYLRLSDRIRLNDGWMSVIRSICEHHLQGRHSQFLSAINLFFKEHEKGRKANATMIAVGNEIETLQEIRNGINEQEYEAHHDADKPEAPEKAKKVQIMFELIDYAWTEEDELLYVPHTWEERIGTLLVEAGIWEERIKRLWSEESQIVLARELRTMPLQIPQGVLKWAGYDEKTALETNLYQVLEALITHDYRGSKWNGKVEMRELKAKLRHIRFPTENVE